MISERVGVDSATGQFNLYNIVNSVSLPQFPAEVGPLVVFLQLYDGIGRYELSMELRNLAMDSKVAAGVFGNLEFPERLVKMELGVPIDLMRLPNPGRHEIAVLFDGRELATPFIDAEVDDGETG